jgi:predicted metal-dependent peptidase
MKPRIQNAIYFLLKTEPYYAHFIMESRILFDVYKVPTAAVAVVNGTPTIIFNSEWIDRWSDEQICGVLKHEILHLVLDHITTTKDEKRDPYISNIAQDCAINQYISTIPPGCVTLDNLSKIVGKKLLPNETSDYYYEHLMQKKKELEKAGTSTLDEHGVAVPGADSPEVARGAIKRVAQKAIQKSAGNVAEHILSAVEKLGDAKLPWKMLLRNAIMSQISRETQATTKKINRRFKLPVPGKKYKRTMTLGVCVDESGSVSEEQHAAFMSEIKSIAKLVSKTYLVHADCEVAGVEDLSKVKFNATRKAGGGTAYQPAITKCKELKCNMIVYFGDFDTADTPTNPGVPFLWVGVGNSPAPANFGKVIRL